MNVYLSQAVDPHVMYIDSGMIGLVLTDDECNVLCDTCSEHMFLLANVI
jgi:hypothetical protein